MRKHEQQTSRLEKISDFFGGRNFLRLNNYKLWIAGSLAATLLPLGAFDLQRVSLTGTADRDAVEYAPGEVMTFTIKADLGGQEPPAGYAIVWERSGDDGNKENGKIDLSGGVAVVKTSIDRPGFVYIRAFIVDAEGKKLNRKVVNKQPVITFNGGAGAAVNDITQAVPEPADFDRFWQKQKERLAAVPVKAAMEKISSANGFDTFAVTVDCAGPRPVTGYLVLPADAAAKSLPLRVTYIGYGVRKQSPPAGNPKKREIHFNVNAHGFELGRDDAYYAEFNRSIKSNGQGYALDPKENADPETAYFNGMALRVMRSLEFAKTLPQWDGKTLLVFGASQGGLQSIWAGALDRDVTLCLTGMPWGCNYAGKAVDRRLGGFQPDYVEALNYYDAVNHAKRITCQTIIVWAGLGDYTCPPSGVAVLYNNLAAPKRIHWYQGSTHGYIPPNVQRFLKEKK